MFSLLLCFLLGVLTVIVAEVLVLLHVVNRLSSKSRTRLAESHVGGDLGVEQSVSFAYNKKGSVWILESEKAPKVYAEDNAPKDQKSKKEILEVYPVKKHAKIKDQSLILTDPNGSQDIIHLVGCSIRAVSASSLPSRKWAKRYPIKVESKSAVIYNGSRIFYIYLETSWEKESWCKSLRLAASADNEKLAWYTKLSGEFHDYVTSLNAGYLSFMKPSTGFSREQADRTSKIDASSSKVRVLLKKIARKTSRGGSENKSSSTSSSGREERKAGEKSHEAQHPLMASGLKASLSEKIANSSEEYGEQSFHPETSCPGGQSQFSVISEEDSNEKSGIDEGTLCWNLLISRLFFDVNRNMEIKSSIQAWVQRTLDNMRTPSYIGGVTCNGLDLGNLPPFIHSMRILPMDMNEVWTMEIDFEYSGGAILDVETRIEVREPAFQRSIENSSLESNSVGEATSHLEGFEDLGDQLKLSGENVDEIENRDDGDSKLDGLKNAKSTSWTSTYVSKWKSMLNSVASQVSQVPLSLAIKVASVRGTLRLHFKPPPSDQLWFGFTSMPDVDFNLASAVGDHKITSGQIALIIGNRLKAAIKETLVLPNCESIWIPWMLSEKDDWVPRNIAPFIWLRHESAGEPTAREAPENAPGETRGELVVSSRGKQITSSIQDEHVKSKNVVTVQHPTYDSSSESTSSQTELVPSSSGNQSTCNRSLQELSTPLLRGESQETSIQRRELLIANEEHRKIGKRERMMGLGKKVGEKIEEKRRQLLRK